MKKLLTIALLALCTLAFAQKQKQMAGQQRHFKSDETVRNQLQRL